MVMIMKHPANRLLDYLDKDDQFEKDIQNIEADLDFQILSKMSAGQLSGEIKTSGGNLEWMSVRAKRIAYPHSEEAVSRRYWGLAHLFRVYVLALSWGPAMITAALAAAVITWLPSSAGYLSRYGSNSPRNVSHTEFKRDKEQIAAVEMRLRSVELQMAELSRRVNAVEAKQEASYPVVGLFSEQSIGAFPAMFLTGASGVGRDAAAPLVADIACPSQVWQVRFGDGGICEGSRTGVLATAAKWGDEGGERLTRAASSKLPVRNRTGFR